MRCPVRAERGKDFERVLLFAAGHLIKQCEQIRRQRSDGGRVIDWTRPCEQRIDALTEAGEEHRLEQQHTEQEIGRLTQDQAEDIENIQERQRQQREEDQLAGLAMLL